MHIFLVSTAVGFLLTSLVLGGCGEFDRQAAAITGHTKVCVDGVTYIQFPSGVTPQYTLDGKLISCTK